jgi:hypothetical protein
MLCLGLFVQLQQQCRHLKNESAFGRARQASHHLAALTFWASLVDGDDWLLVCGVDGLERLSLLALYPLAIDVQADGLLVRDARGLDLLC